MKRSFCFFVLSVSTLFLTVSSKANDCLTANLIASEEGFAESPTAGSLSGAGFSGDAQCEGTGANDDVWYRFVAVATKHGVRAMGSGDLDLAIEIYDACGGAQLSCQNSTAAGGTENALVSGLTVGNTYFYRVYHAGAAPATTQDFFTSVAHVPFVELISSDCGTLDFNTNDVIRATNPSDTQNFTNYQFRFVEQEAPFDTYTITSPNGTNPNFLLQWFPQIEYGRTYEVSVRVRAILPTYGDFGNTCIIGLQNNVLTTSVENQYSGGFFDFCDIIGATKVALSEQYRWTFLDFGADPPEQSEVLGLGDSRQLNLYRVPNLKLGTTYIVTVFATVAGDESPAGGLRFINMNNAVPNTGLNSDLYPCGGTYPISSFIQAREVCQAESYTWRFTNTSQVQPQLFYTRDDGSRFVDLDFVTGLIVGDSYDVEVLAEQGDLTGDYSTVCNITIGISENPNLLLENQQESEVNDEVSEFRADGTTYRNWDMDVSPVTGSGNMFEVALFSEDPSQIAFLEVYDLNGRKVAIKSPRLSVGEVNRVDLSGFSSGVYIFRMYNGSKQETRKVVTF